MSRPPHLPPPNNSNSNLQSSSLCSFLHLLVTSAVFGPNILLSTLFSNTLSLCSFLP
jgi:hypothetical protein